MPLSKMQENAVESFAKWAMRSENAGRVMAPTEAYTTAFASNHDLSLPELIQNLEKAGLLLPVTHFALSQLSAEKTVEGVENLIDEYLRRRGWRETPLGRQTLQAIRDARLSIFEVLDGKDGESLTVRDLMADETPLMIDTPHVRWEELREQGLAGRLATLNGELTFILTPLTMPIAYMRKAAATWQAIPSEERSDKRIGALIVIEFLESLWAQAEDAHPTT